MDATYPNRHRVVGWPAPAGAGPAEELTCRLTQFAPATTMGIAAGRSAIHVHRPDVIRTEGEPMTPGRLWNRELAEYPPDRTRYRLLGLTVLASIVMYYQQYVSGAVAPSILAHYQMTFRFYLTITVVSSIFGAVSSLLAALGDRWGRANLVVVGLLAVSLLTGLGVPNAPDPRWPTPP